MSAESLGMIEVTGFLGVIAAADTVLKAADVEILQVEKISGGLTTLQVTGDVGAVQAAIQAGVETASSLNCLVSSHVIPRVDPSVLKMETIGIKEKIELVEEVKKIPLEEKGSEKKAEKKK